MDIHLIPGLGTDHRIFQRLLVHHPSRIAHDWPRMANGSTLRHFAQALAERIDTSRPHVLLGMSMGGMVAQELAAITQPRHVVIVSSWKGPHEMPPAIRLMRRTHPERVLTKVMLARIATMVRWQMGVTTHEEVVLLDSFMHGIALEQLKVQIAAVLGWPGPVSPVKDILHIHGDQDRLMPLDLVRDAVVVPGGSHFMVWTQAAEVEAIIRSRIPELSHHSV
jgi:pimeloyl-ACP methyl ester carboxylesterase